MAAGSGENDRGIPRDKEFVSDCQGEAHLHPPFYIYGDH